MGEIGAFLELCDRVDELNDSSDWALELTHLCFDGHGVVLGVRVETCTPEILDNRADSRIQRPGGQFQAWKDLR